MNFTDTYYSESPSPSNILNIDTTQIRNILKKKSFDSVIEYKPVYTNIPTREQSQNISHNIIKLTYNLTKYFLEQNKIRNDREKCPIINENQVINYESYYDLLINILSNIFIINTDGIDIINFYNNINLFNYLHGLYSLKRLLNPEEHFDPENTCGRQVEFFIKYVVRDITNFYFTLIYSKNNIAEIIDAFARVVINRESIELKNCTLSLNSRGDKGTIVNVAGFGYFLNFIGGQTSYELGLWNTKDSADLIYYNPFVEEIFIIDSKYYSGVKNSIINKENLIFIQCLLYFFQNWLSTRSQIFNIISHINIQNIYMGDFIFLHNENGNNKNIFNYTDLYNIFMFINGDNYLKNKLLGLIINNYKFTDYLKDILNNPSLFFKNERQRDYIN